MTSNDPEGYSPVQRFSSAIWWIFMQHFAWLLLTQHITWSLGDRWTSCNISINCVVWLHFKKVKKYFAAGNKKLLNANVVIQCVLLKPELPEKCFWPLVYCPFLWKAISSVSMCSLRARMPDAWGWNLICWASFFQVFWYVCSICFSSSYGDDFVKMLRRPFIFSALYNNCWHQ